MNTKLLLLAVSVAAFSSCTTLYKSGQTPDDVYFSPARPAGGYVEDRRDDRREYANSNTYNSEYRTIRMGISDPRWRYLDNNYSSDLYLNDYSYSPYNYGYNYGYYYNPFYYPYPVYGGGIILAPSVVKNTTPRTGNLSGYNPAYNNAPVRNIHGIAPRPVRTYNNNNRGSAVGNVMRQIFTPSNSANNTNNANRPAVRNNNNDFNNSSSNNRTYTPSSSTSSSSSSAGSSSGGGVSRPPRN